MTDKEIRRWELIRLKGKSHYIFWYGIIPAVAFGALISLVRVLRDSGYSLETLDFSWLPFYLVISIPLSSVLGILVAVAVWNRNEAHYLMAKKSLKR